MKKQDLSMPSTGIRVRYFDADAWGQDEICIAIDMSVVTQQGRRPDGKRELEEGDGTSESD